MKLRNIILAIGTLAMTSLTAAAQDKVEGTIATDFVSQYIWRGQDLGSISVQPTLGISYKGLSLTGWGSVGLADASDVKEFDLTLGYTIGGFNVGVTDYWFSEGADPRGRYFKYDKDGTNHVLEANIGYDFGFLSVQWFTNFYGNDGVNNSGKTAYSSYFEIAAPFSFIGCDWTAALGAVPYASTYYGNSGFAITNVSLRATKAIKVTNTFDIPVFAGITANPCSQKAYLVAGFTLHI